MLNWLISVAALALEGNEESATLELCIQKIRLSPPL